MDCLARTPEKFNLELIENKINKYQFQIVFSMFKILRIASLVHFCVCGRVIDRRGRQHTFNCCFVKFHHLDLEIDTLIDLLFTILNGNLPRVINLMLL